MGDENMDNGDKLPASDKTSDSDERLEGKLRPKKGPHPMGPPRNTVALAITQYMTEDKSAGGSELKILCEHVREEVGSPAKYGDVLMQMAVGRETKSYSKEGDE